MATAPNTCTILANNNEELRKYLSGPMEDLDQTLPGCDLCGNLFPALLFRVCAGGGCYLGECCAKKKGNGHKLITDRRGTHKVCPVANCRCAPCEPTVDRRVTKMMLAGRTAVEQYAKDAREAEIREDAHVAARAALEATGRLKRKVKNDYAPETWAAMRTAKKQRKLARDEAKEVALYNAKLVPLQRTKLVETLGNVNAYEAWLEKALEEAEAKDAEMAEACEECEECEA